ncbi:MAG: hypothetical protein QOI41_6800 [Myxococcales bacterium]|nr:hypothetical protein [Myxococcales bacterium]
MLPVFARPPRIQSPVSRGGVIDRVPFAGSRFRRTHGNEGERVASQARRKAVRAPGEPHECRDTGPDGSRARFGCPRGGRGRGAGCCAGCCAGSHMSRRGTGGRARHALSRASTLRVEPSGALQLTPSPALWCREQRVVPSGRRAGAGRGAGVRLRLRLRLRRRLRLHHRRKRSSSHCAGCTTWGSGSPTRVERSTTSRSVASRTATS